MKYLLLIALCFVVLWLLRKAQTPPRTGGQAPPTARAPEQMVKCAHCGVNQPVSESVLAHGRYYCCNAHRHEAGSRDGG
ncbi:PP0621 family protein [Propionivibrio sp.]|uniref:PP0621 family protein n=1 Tax=Propionivibrio sp. TaxID=2212460 RepID=UPI002624A050|nr:PP0621 family protein [Propionivibrio sp.]